MARAAENSVAGAFASTAAGGSTLWIAKNPIRISSANVIGPARLTERRGSSVK
jgi:hypothetical protein